MKTEILSEKEIDRAAQFLKRGELVAFPTETVYGLGASIFQPESIQNIFKIKKRPQNNPLIAHIGDFQQWEMIGENPPDTFFLLAKNFFPGPLTLIINKKVEIDQMVSAGLQTIAIRIPDHPLARKLIQQMKEPLVAPSANLSGTPSSTTVEHVLHDFEGKIAAVMDGGSCFHGLESTVIDLVSFEKPTLLRYGALNKEAIERVLSQKLDVYTEGPKSSPGMQYRHYAPKIPVHIFSEKKRFTQYLLKAKNALVLSSEPTNEKQIPLKATSLYSCLRMGDVKGYNQIVVFLGNCKEEALLHRLRKIAEESKSSFDSK